MAGNSHEKKAQALSYANVIAMHFMTFCVIVFSKYRNVQVTLTAKTCPYLSVSGFTSRVRDSS